MTAATKPDAEPETTNKEWVVTVSGIVAVTILASISLTVNHLNMEGKLIILTVSISLIAGILGVKWRYPIDK